jgi:hypothetical protein
LHTNQPWTGLGPLRYFFTIVCTLGM